MRKSELRSLYLKKRRDLSPPEIAAESRQIAERFFTETDLTLVRTIHCFISIARFGEIDTSLIYERIWAEFPNIRTVAPRMNKTTGTLEGLPFNSVSGLIENSWGIREPASNEIVDPTEIDMVLVPLLCYDRNGDRVGYGKGFYDRFLSTCRPDCLNIGLSFFAPVDKIDDVSESDVPLDRCITPDKVYEFQARIGSNGLALPK